MDTAIWGQLVACSLKDQTILMKWEIDEYSNFALFVLHECLFLFKIITFTKMQGKVLFKIIIITNTCFSFLLYFMCLPCCIFLPISLWLGPYYYPLQSLKFISHISELLKLFVLSFGLPNTISKAAANMTSSQSNSVPT